jgi:isoquinoline 1-oxidoreductase alpha subunit
MASFTINDEKIEVKANPNTPLLWVVREHLKLTGTKFGCGVGQCGACMVHVDGSSTYSCMTPVSAVEGKQVTTIEGLSSQAEQALQKAWVSEEVPQCGYCQSGQIMRAADLLKTNPHPSRQDIINHMRTNICRCGTYNRIIKAIQRAAEEI